jgi:serine/threonine protein kinase
MTEQQYEEFMGECELMMSLRPHKNVVQLLGVCIDQTNPLWYVVCVCVCVCVSRVLRRLHLLFSVVTDFQPNGSLHSLVCKHVNSC